MDFEGVTSQKLLGDSHPLPKIENEVERKKNALKSPWKKISVLCPQSCSLPNTPFIRVITLCLFVLSTWTTLQLLLIRLNLPTTDLFKTLGLVLMSYYVGELFQMLHLPNIVGMYLTGVLFRNVNCFSSIETVRPGFIMARYVAVSVVLMRSGLGLNAKICQTYPLSVLKLSTLPAAAEAVAMAIAIKLLLPYNYSWLWSFLFGFSISAVSPTLTSQILSRMKSKSLYHNEKLTSLYTTSAPIEDIFCISAFAVFTTTIIQTSGGIPERFGLGLLHLLLGLTAGASWGALSAYLPHKDDEHCTLKRSLMIFLGSATIYFGAKYISTPAGGPLGSFITGATAAACFKFQGWQQVNPVSTVISNLWSWFMEPMLFALVGIEIDLSVVELYDVGLNVIVIIIGSIARCIFCSIMLIGTGFNCNEKIFFILASFPKATVEAALGPQAFDLFWNTPDHDKSLNILRTSVLSVIVVTTISTIALKLFSYRLLVKPNPVAVVNLKSYESQI
ncbi:sodium/hydrogen exchanger 9B2-like isoform X2 [Cimex lectularius]|uniref:Cation/H+ exchanger transmembrane domain-containing protein n=1 Tax=Cimex lectularius TaxID=79782 RepID=A0A8I6RX46_CIMLE|nr:sodium/hydrogen exchanger 9B2-like isoform X2 [Cimex lectularius]